MTNTAAKTLAKSSTASIRFATCSDIGLKRAINQDSYQNRVSSHLEWPQHGHLFVVADGMGAHAAGELASQLAADEVGKADGAEDFSVSLIEAFHKANAIIHEQGQSNAQLYNMGTTCSAIWLLPTGAIIGHVGDSRIYRVREQRIEQLTFDHSLVWEMRAAGQISGTNRSTIPRNVITRCLGPHAHVEIDLEGPFEIREGDTFLLCSDGLTGRIEDAELGAAMRTLPPEEAAEFLVDLANLRGGHDNITATIVEVSDPDIATAPGFVKKSSEATETHPALWFAAGLGLIFALAGFAMESTNLGVAGVVLFVVAALWIAIRFTSSRSKNKHGFTKPGPPYARTTAKVSDEFLQDIIETFRSAVDTTRAKGEADESVLLTLDTDIDALTHSSPNDDPNAACKRIRNIAQRLRSL